MNIYDFDNAVYDGNSSVDFMWFCFRKKPILILNFFPLLMNLFLYIFEKRNMEKLKESFFAFLKKVEDPIGAAEEFWRINEFKIKPWYYEMHTDTDIFISESPRFLLEPICKKLNVELVATEVDSRTGKITGHNCKEGRKAQMLTARHRNIHIENYYCEPLAGHKLLLMADNTYVVKGERFIKKDNYTLSLAEKTESYFANKQFLLFLMCGLINGMTDIFGATLFSFLIEAHAAFVLGYLSGLVVAYYLNSKLTFKREMSFKGYLRFSVSYIPNFIVQNIIVIIFHDMLGFGDLLTYALAGILAVPITFIALKSFAFKKKK